MAYNVRRCCLLVRPEAHAGAERASSEYAAEELHEEREAVALVAACVPILCLWEPEAEALNSLSLCTGIVQYPCPRCLPAAEECRRRTFSPDQSCPEGYSKYKYLLDNYVH